MIGWLVFEMLFGSFDRRRIRGSFSRRDGWAWLADVAGPMRVRERVITNATVGVLNYSTTNRSY